MFGTKHVGSILAFIFILRQSAFQKVTINSDGNRASININGSIVNNNKLQCVEATMAIYFKICVLRLNKW